MFFSATKGVIILQEKKKAGEKKKITIEVKGGTQMMMMMTTTADEGRQKECQKQEKCNEGKKPLVVTKWGSLNESEECYDKKPQIYSLNFQPSFLSSFLP